jgi:multidrug efflux pump subunit AcrA (membrane-fusion protein)
LKKSNIIVVIIVFLFLGMWLFLGKDFQSEKKTEVSSAEKKLPTVVVQSFESVKKDVSLEYFGKVFLGRSYSFESQYADKIILNVEKGERVAKGDVLFSYQNNGLKAQKRALLAEKARLEVEEKALESLRSKNFSSEIDYKTVLENKARINSSIVSIDDEIRRSTKIAPEDGVVE